MKELGGQWTEGRFRNRAQGFRIPSTILNYGPLRTTPDEPSAPQRSTMDTSNKRLTLHNRGGPIWGSRGREFKSR
jgi:hypothetical protein